MLDVLLGAGQILHDLEAAEKLADWYHVKLQEATFVIELEPEPTHLKEHVIDGNLGQLLEKFSDARIFADFFDLRQLGGTPLLVGH